MDLTVGTSQCWNSVNEDGLCWPPSVLIIMLTLTVLGGHDGLSIFSTVERFDPVEKVWTMVTPMYTRRCRVGVTTARGKLFR